MQDLQISEVQLQRMVADEELAYCRWKMMYFVAEAEPIEQGRTKIGFEDFDPSKDLEDVTQNLPAQKLRRKKWFSRACCKSNADVIVEAIQPINFRYNNCKAF